MILSLRSAAAFTGALLFVAATAAPLAAQAGQPLEKRAAPPLHPAPAPPAPTAAELVAPPADALRLSPGVAYKVLRQGSQSEKPPRDLDIVAIFTVGRSPAGEVFQDSFAQGKPQRMQVRHAFPAWREAMKSMVAGEVRRFWFAAEALPPNPKTGQREPAVFDVEMVSVGRLPDPPRSIRTPDPKAKVLPSGTAVLTVSPGKGDKKVRRSDGAMVSFTVWDPAGQAINSSIAEGRPTLFPVAKVMPAFADCLEGMTPGERRHCWIPAERNEGFPGAMTGALVFEVELLSVMDFDQVLQGRTAPPPKSPGG